MLNWHNLLYYAALAFLLWLCLARKSIRSELFSSLIEESCDASFLLGLEVETLHWPFAVKRLVRIRCCNSPIVLCIRIGLEVTTLHSPLATRGETPRAD